MDDKIKIDLSATDISETTDGKKKFAGARLVLYDK